ncbi:pre-mRNA splicing factor [Trichosporon asahii var. asahii CBS 2479]|uniref:RNA helicase n=1 Tax=Trichosporon asahii var. asahii (strain ATCC 90039 / CBS 2479 / JCM 2466 / KCTC 7840 / NBRC 103889/ NCYC 2677 / UAMH 7654) TaxID=1186058 RepID=J6ETI6_TRIAS|nr:pre-mRNA splicing factor [Trichosporon asahii var. asahii CBS 2479]EJT46062.1 pre-mRNA splicing factor [Trichosporon asahii var. asahii CBS 2479]
MPPKFWKPGTAAPAEEGGAAVSSAPRHDLSLEAQRRRLPVFKHREKLLYCVERYQVTIVVGQTGSGKSTQIPQYLHEAGWSADGRVVACTQPRRVAATSVATRVAEEVGSVLGDEVGYSIRFEDLSDPQRTRIKYMTDGMLFRECMLDPLLSKYSVIMLTSVVSLEGRMYPVEVAFLSEPCADYGQAAIDAVFAIHTKIDTAIQAVADRAASLPPRAPKILALPLYATLPVEEQEIIFEPPPKDTRKVIFATNIAEASVTIDGIKYVVDSGFVKLKTFNPRTGMDVLTVTPCSLASANQRAGRAGRTSAGKCLRLYPPSILPTNNALSPMPVTTPPELVRSDISTYLLQLKALGIENLAKFDFMSPPPSDMMVRALEFLYSLKALDDSAHLTPLGERIAELPLDPMMATILLNSAEFRCSEEILTIAAMTSVQGVFNMPDGGPNTTKGALAEVERRKFTAEEGDHLTLLNAYNAFMKYGQRDKSWCGQRRLNYRALQRAQSIRKQLKKYLERFGIRSVSCEGDHVRLRKCLVSGYFKCTRGCDAVRSPVVCHVHAATEHRLGHLHGRAGDEQELYAGSDCDRGGVACRACFKGGGIKQH